ncbi:MAG: thiamine-phosphate kinase [Actinobacteria bacterium]|nr:thiamine-phosphate kinase [Actinomycetota bacterium]
MNESEILAFIKNKVGSRSAKVEVPIGDDAALFRFNSDTSLLTIDSFYEGTHFSLDYFDLRDVGWKAVSAAISDIAAMGGAPECAMVSCGFSSPPSPEGVRSLIEGVLESLDACGCELIGGDVCRSPAGLLLTVAVAGTPPEGGPVLRGGAKSGDLIGVTGTLGDSAGGLSVLQTPRAGPASEYPRLENAHLRPKPRVTEGRLLSAAGVSAMEDLSDGLITDVGHICEMSRLGCIIESAYLPLSEELERLAESRDVDPLAWALSGGEDYELVFTASPDRFGDALKVLSSNGVRATKVGEMKPVDSGVRILSGAGEVIDPAGNGFEHFME